MNYESNKVSEWNEANLKMFRLHDSQVLINECKRDPKGFNNGRFNFESWAIEVGVLFGEGESKYTADELKKVDKIKADIRTLLRTKHPSKTIVNSSFGSNVKGFIIDDKKLYDLIEKIEEYERIVKDYNDKHGLSTKNKEYSGLF